MCEVVYEIDKSNGKERSSSLQYYLGRVVWNPTDKVEVFLSSDGPWLKGLVGPSNSCCRTKAWRSIFGARRFNLESSKYLSRSHYHILCISHREF